MDAGGGIQPRRITPKRFPHPIISPFLVPDADVTCFHNTPKSRAQRNVTTVNHRREFAHDYINLWAVATKQNPYLRFNSGRSGESAVFIMNGRMASFLQTYDNTWTSRVDHGRPFTNEHFVMKVIVPYDTDDVEEFVHEALMHKLLSKRTTSKFGYSTSAVVPPFYFGGYDPNSGVYVIIMGLIRGMPARTILETRMLFPSEFAAIQQAIMALWANGVMHGDFHTGNVILVGSHTAVLVDFGMAFLLPETCMPKSISDLTDQTWAERAMVHGDLIFQDMYDWYNADPEILGQLAHFVRQSS